jgi:hypothetical protein
VPFYPVWLSPKLIDTVGHMFMVSAMVKVDLKTQRLAKRGYLVNRPTTSDPPLFGAGVSPRVPYQNSYMSFWILLPRSCSTIYSVVGARIHIS